MIQCNKTHVEFEGEKEWIKAEFVGIASSIKEIFGEEEYRDLLRMAEMSEEELRDELNELKQREVYGIIKYLMLASLLRSECEKEPEETEET